MKFKSLGMIAVVLGLVIGLEVIVAHFYNNYFSRDSGKKAVLCTSSTAHNYQVQIKDNSVNPAHIDGKLCDKLTITNLDSQVRNMAFGEHINHTPYDGIEEKNLSQDQSLTITFDKLGSYIFHDHFQESVEGSFTVSAH